MTRRRGCFMKILACSDWQGSPEALLAFLDLAEIEEPNLVAFLGNILPQEPQDFGFYRSFYEGLKMEEAPVALIPGKLDAPLDRYLALTLTEVRSSTNLHLVHRSFFHLGRDFVVAGFGGEITKDEREERYLIRYPRWEAESAFEFLREIPQENRIFLFHSLPIGHLDQEGGKHTGSLSVNHLVKFWAPRLALCGSARSPGKEWVGDSLVVCPGALREGNAAIINTRTHAVEFRKLPLQVAAR